MIPVILIFVRIIFYVVGGVEAVRRRNYLVWLGFVFFIMANTVFGFGVTGGTLEFFRTAGAIALVTGYYHRSKIFITNEKGISSELHPSH